MIGNVSNNLNFGSVTVKLNEGTQLARLLATEEKANKRDFDYVNLGQDKVIITEKGTTRGGPITENEFTFLERWLPHNVFQHVSFDVGSTDNLFKSKDETPQERINARKDSKIPLYLIDNTKKK